MNTHRILSLASALVFLGGLMPAMNASAQHRSATAGRPTMRSPQPSPSRVLAGAANRSSGRSAPSGLGSSRGSNLGAALSNGLSRSRSNGLGNSRSLGNGIGNGAILNQLSRQWGNGGYGDGGYGYGGNRGPGYYNYRAAEEYADAYRDAALANAAVGLVGVLVGAAVQADRPQYTTAVPAQPAGHYETRRTLVREGYYESRQVWVPEQVDPRTGEIIDGHHETRRTYVQPVYEETQVFVPAPVQVVQTTPVVCAPAPRPVHVVAPLPPPLPMGTTVVHVGR